MSQGLRNISRAIGVAVCVIVLPALALAQTKTSHGTPKTTKHEQTINFEVVAVDGNKVIVKGAGGTKEVVAADDMKFSVDGKPVTYKDLKPGMKGSARITTTTTVIPVHITEVKTGEVMQRNGNSLIVRTENGIKMFSEGDVAQRNMTIIKDGQPAHITDFRAGDKLVATIVTPGTPKVMTQRQVDAMMSGAPTQASGSKATGATAAGSAATGGATGAAGGGASSSGSRSHRKLPKTATSLPAVGLTGALFLSLGIALTAARRRGR